MHRNVIGFALALVFASSLALRGTLARPILAAAAPRVAQTASVEAPPPPPSYRYDYSYGPDWGYRHGPSFFEFFLAPLFCLFWLAVPVVIIFAVLRGRRQGGNGGPARVFGGSGPAWLAEWHRRMHDGNLSNPPVTPRGPDATTEPGGTA